MKRQVRNSRQRIRQCEGGEVRAITKRFIADSCHRIWQCEGGGFGRIPSYADDRVFSIMSSEQNRLLITAA